AILPGGQGELASSTQATVGSSAQVTRDVFYPGDNVAKPARIHRRDWKLGAGSGRSLYIVDVASGRLLRKWDSDDCATDPPPTYGTCLHSPMVGSVSVYPNAPGT